MIASGGASKNIMRIRKNYLVGLIRIIVLTLWIISVPLFFMLAKFLKMPGYTKIPHKFHAGTCCILGIQVVESGEMSLARPTLYVSNHVSYLDIFVLGRLPAYFIAKSEVANWPVFGKLAEFQNTLFIERTAGKTGQQLETLKQHLAKGNSLTLFPEGTSTEGVQVAPFKSSFIESANADEGLPRVTIQPITVAYTHHGGEKIDSQEARDHYAWYAKTPFLPHFLGLMPLKKVRAKIHYHPVCYYDEFESRRHCTDHCRDAIATKLDELVG
ncbi:MAG: 1-acyl-sn-glycerol-3-phosphate acyltransferase [Arenicella sp.]|jgi:1-acyl-sn-glycerol-3-phosphate acyltransferase